MHEEKIQRQEQIDDIIFDKLKERPESIDHCSQRPNRRNQTNRKTITNRNQTIKG